MTRRILSAVMCLAMLFCLASCSKLESPDESTTAETAETSAAEEKATADLSETDETEAASETEEKTAAPESSATVTGKESSVTLTEKVTAVATTVKAAVKKTTARSTTKATTKATTRATTKATTASSTGHTTMTTAAGTRTSNKYGVIVYTSSDGTVAVDRFWYTGTYSELLPAAKANRKTYASYIEEVLELTNAMRAEKNLAPLTLSEKLTEQANVRAEEIAWSGKHSHYRPSGSYFSSIFKDNGFSTGTAGENIGWGYATASSVCDAWKASETHYENIMTEKFVSIGIGVAADADPDGKLVWVQHFYSEKV